jgi:phosphatidate cytidylyltransferase
MIVKRIISSLIFILIAILGILIDWVCGLGVTLLVGIGLYEFFTLIEKKGITIYKYFGIIIGMIIPLSVYFRFELTKRWELLFIISVLIFIFLLQFTRRENSQAILGISTTLFGILYIAWLLSFLIKIKYLSLGRELLATLLLVTKGGDIGAYLVGSRFGKHNLIPRISPKKSIEGAIGGFIFSILGAMASRLFLPQFSLIYLIIIGTFLGILAQLGDLSESLIKRDCQVKDSGHLTPGLGGALDIVDSLLFTTPVFYFYMSTVLK